MNNTYTLWPSRRLLILLATLAISLGAFHASPSILPAQTIDSVASSEHVQVRLPSERQSFGRDIIADIERCYIFMNGAAGGRLPRKITVVINWDQTDNSCNRREASITVGMNHPAGIARPKAFLMHGAAREIARLGLLELSQGAERDDNKFLFEGMIEILAREFEQNSRSIEGAWVIAGILDKMQTLGLNYQRTWSVFSKGKANLRNAAPGITFLMVLREFHGRERLLKFFESLKRGTLNECLTAIFKAPAAELETAWLKKVREFQTDSDISIVSDNAPNLVQTSMVPETGLPGVPLQIRLFLKDASSNLEPEGVFVADERTGRVFQAQPSPDKGAGYLSVLIPLEGNCPPGQYNYRATVVDEAGNVRNWKGAYQVAAP